MVSRVHTAILSDPCWLHIQPYSIYCLFWKVFIDRMWSKFESVVKVVILSPFKKWRCYRLLVGVASGGQSLPGDLGKTQEDFSPLFSNCLNISYASFGESNWLRHFHNYITILGDVTKIVFPVIWQKMFFPSFSNRISEFLMYLRSPTLS